MELRAIFLAILLVSACASQAQGTPQKNLSPRCTKTIRQHSPYPPGPFKFDKNERYKGAPVIKYQIQEDGSVTDVSLERSSGIADIDKKFLDAIAKWKFKPRASGCGIIETKMEVIIDWAAP